MGERNSFRREPTGQDARVRQFVGLLAVNERHLQSYIFSLVLNLDVAEQISQETMLRLWKQFDQFDPSKGDFGSWSRTIARYQVLTFRKQARRERLLFDSELVAALADRAAARADELALRQSALVDCLKKLPGRGQELIRLYYYLGMKIRTAAEKLGRSVAATEKALTRIRRTLYDCVQLAVQREEHG